MEDLSRTPQSNIEPPPPAAQGTDMLPHQASSATSAGSCLSRASIVLGVVSIIISILALLLLPSTLSHSYSSTDRMGQELDKAVYVAGLVLWLLVGGLPALISFICAVGYSTAPPSERGSALWPMLIGFLALVVGVATLILLSLVLFRWANS